MSILGTRRASGLATHSGSMFSRGIRDITGFKISGMASSNAIACCLFVWSGNALTGDGFWVVEAGMKDKAE